MKKVFAEMGLGNETFFSTEIEEGEREYRIPEFMKPEKITDYYIRIWIGKRVLIISTKDGLKLKTKTKTAFKLLLGIGGIGI